MPRRVLDPRSAIAPELILGRYQELGPEGNGARYGLINVPDIDKYDDRRASIRIGCPARESGPFALNHEHGGADRQHGVRHPTIRVWPPDPFDRIEGANAEVDRRPGLDRPASE